MKTLITANLDTPRVVTKNGKRFLVAPATLIVPGILHGNHGPLLYPTEEIAQSVTAWDGQPLTLRHPTGNKSASNPEVLEAQGIGIIKHPFLNRDGSLKAYIWIDEQKMKSMDAATYNHIKKGGKIELSTGLILDEEATTGRYKGEFYRAIARNYQPDHLAILPNEKGACSIKDGCGVNNLKRRNKTQVGVKNMKDADKKKLVRQLIANCDCWTDEDEDVLMNLSDESLKREMNRVETANAEAKKLQDLEKSLNELKAQHETVTNELSELKKAKPEPKEGKEEVKNEEKKQEPLTDEQYINSAPPTLQKAFRNAIKLEEHRRMELVARLTENVKKEDKEAVTNALKSKDIDDLELMVKMLPEKQTENKNDGRFASFLGMGNVQQTNNATLTEEEEDDVLETPILNFAKKQA